ncbi:MAG: cisplatin damage response ATP-dependent DNA ligase [Aestuariivirga sp.]
MRAFAELLDRLAYAQARNAKLKLLRDYFLSTPDPDRGWALSALTDGLPVTVPLRRTLAQLMEEKADPVLFRLSRDYVGDTAETVSLLWPSPSTVILAKARIHGSEPEPSLGAMDSGFRQNDEVGGELRLSEVVDSVRATSSRGFPRLLESYLDRLDVKGRFALIKLLSGALRVGVSARLAKQALAGAFGKDIEQIEETWHGIEPPYAGLFAWLEGTGERPDTGKSLIFRPVMLAHPIAADDWPGMIASDWMAEWKWDGIRIQVAADGFRARIFTRNGDEISAGFPEVAERLSCTRGVADGELLILRDGLVAPFNDLQQRLNRKTVTAKMQALYPAHVRLYDLLFDGHKDLRSLALMERRARLALWAQSLPNADLSEDVPFTDFPELEERWKEARANGIEGLMLKRKDSPYLQGRPKGYWYKWKRAALTLDCVLMYAQRGSGKRSSYYSDLTFGVWSDPATLVPVGKAYSGFTDEELLRLDKWIRNNTAERFGPVRSVTPSLVLEIAFDAVQPSTRHKSGVAMRFPRVHRIRWDKPAAEADTLTAIKALI